ncbi:MAG: type I methionyl aminopeptidase [Chloroflexota bacterium]
MGAAGANRGRRRGDGWHEALSSRIKSAEELALMRRAGAIVAQVLEHIRGLAVPGVSTLQLDHAAEALIRDLGGEPSFKGYHGYPGSICASINEEVVHGIPGARRMAEGDIVSIDVGAIWRDYQGDSAITVAVGEVSAEARRLIGATEAALEAGIVAARAGARLGDVSHAIEAAAETAGFAVVREYGGHGIGRQMHEDPRIPNWGEPGRGMRLAAGMTICLEPMLTAGGYATRVLQDGWTVVTADGSLSAHSEHTIAITDDGSQVLTVPDRVAV